jgi:5'(3')-deoxyribonucleotidase
MKIGIDLDGVLRDIHTPLCDIWYRNTGIRKSPTDLVGWNCHQYLEVEKAGMTAEEFYQWWFNSNYIYALATVIPNSQDAIAQLAEKHDLILVSSQPTPNARLWAIKFVDRYFLGMFKAMYFGSDKSLVYLDAMVDDAVHNLKPNVARHRVLFDQPWNQDAPRSIYRARDWRSVLDYFLGRRWE